MEKWIEEHRHDDVNELALRAAHCPDVDMREAIVQIRGWQIAEKKLPLWAETQGIRFPDHLPLEQCSSQLTAEYKASLVGVNENENQNLHSMTDLTGGFGVDAVMMGRRFQHLTYVEQREDLCELARHNFPLLGLKDFEVIHGDCVETLKHLPHQNLLLIDPARRDA
ncbi:MAG: SAM-dependent methyltransferase, partial [Bacteroidaceae bacterium]|nr:SAM-dependent methyltransferase [Bacteroidaceae bacterium]